MKISFLHIKNELSFANILTGVMIDLNQRLQIANQKAPGSINWRRGFTMDDFITDMLDPPECH
jgi:hypothetical protein